MGALTTPRAITGNRLVVLFLLALAGAAAELVISLRSNESTRTDAGRLAGATAILTKHVRLDCLAGWTATIEQEEGYGLPDDVINLNGPGHAFAILRVYERPMRLSLADYAKATAEARAAGAAKREVTYSEGAAANGVLIDVAGQMVPSLVQDFDIGNGWVQIRHHVVYAKVSSQAGSILILFQAPEKEWESAKQALLSMLAKMHFA